MVTARTMKRATRLGFIFLALILGTVPVYHVDAGIGYIPKANQAGAFFGREFLGIQRSEHGHGDAVEPSPSAVGTASPRFFIWQLRNVARRGIGVKSSGIVGTDSA